MKDGADQRPANEPMWRVIFTQYEVHSAEDGSLETSKQVSDNSLHHTTLMHLTQRTVLTWNAYHWKMG
jgi:hypothetical protein